MSDYLIKTLASNPHMQRIVERATEHVTAEAYLGSLKTTDDYYKPSEAEKEEEAERKRRETFYNIVSEMSKLEMHSNSTFEELEKIVNSYGSLIVKLEGLGNYEDSEKLLLQCREKFNKYNKKYLPIKEELERLAAKEAQEKLFKAKIGFCIHLGLMGLFALIFFDTGLREYLYGYNGLLISDGGWWARHLLAAAPLGGLIFAMSIVSLLLRKGSHDEGRSNISASFLTILYFVFTINVGWGGLSNFWGSAFSSNLFIFIPNIIVAMPFLFIWTLCDDMSET